MLDLTKDNFEAEVLQADGTVFVDYYGDGCIPCAELMPFVHEMADKYGDKIKFASLNTTKPADWLLVRESLVSPLWLFTRTVKR